ncbi:sigma-70 family RNA polymerase sigma factor [Streptomyces longispororuber]|uniref:sigma-70 family RNA polymerase sigma factor n=1 Tax=Streptomyces longispororuber TaxID=68230 RepID=UPI00210C658B|nr:sigma-70 family RNA polymerase sigma factor [Streptomyces longispororuber]MCQ4207689.1 sigma-70 family RNA polymerase sigma factor [Streptomyces longispororuber]
MNSTPTSATERSSTERMEEAVSAFMAFRPRLFRIAHHILRRPADVEDIVQEAWLRWQNTDRAEVLDPPAYLAQITIRLSLNAAGSARSRYESSAGPWLADTCDSGPDPFARAEEAEALDQALGLLVDRLNPTERAVYILRVAFDFPYSEIAARLQLSTINTRQIASRAGKRLLSDDPDPARHGDHQRLMDAFLTAARGGDLGDLETLLTRDTVLARAKARGPRPCTRPTRPQTRRDGKRPGARTSAAVRTATA